MAKAAKKKGPAVGSKMVRWTQEEIDLLNRSVSESRTAREAFASVSKEVGREPGTVQAKYYQMQRRASKVKRQAKTAPKAVVLPKPVPRYATSINVRQMSLEELLQSHGHIKKEIARRQEELNAQLKRLQELDPR